MEVVSISGGDDGYLFGWGYRDHVLGHEMAKLSVILAGMLLNMLLQGRFILTSV